MAGPGPSLRTSAHRQAEPPGQLRSESLQRAVMAVEHASALDGAARALGRGAGAVVRTPRAEDALRGTWLGHALHPLLTDLPLGMWTSATLLDLVGGRRSRRGATTLVAAGLLSAVPTAVTGLAEYRSIERRSQRVAVVHAASNALTSVAYGASLVARLRGRHGKGVSLGVVGALTSVVGGYLGGHLTLVRKLGTTDPGYDDGYAGEPAVPPLGLVP